MTIVNMIIKYILYEYNEQYEWYKVTMVDCLVEEEYEEEEELVEELEEDGCLF